MFPSSTRLLMIGALVAAAMSSLACTSPAAAPVAPARIAITVDENGYTPSEVQAQAGQPLTLVFTRVSDKGCGETLVFPDRDLRRDLPLNTAVVVDLTPKGDERIAFTCGMGMYKGAVIAQGSDG